MRNKRISILIAAILAVTLFLVACGNAENNGFKASDYIVSVESQIYEMEAIITVTISDDWENGTSVKERNLIRQEATEAYMKEEKKNSDKIDRLSVKCVTESGEGFDLTPEEGI